MPINPLPPKKLPPKPAPSAPTGTGPIDAIAALLAIKPVDLAGLLSDPKVQQVIADAISAHTGSTPDLADPVEAQLARNFVGSGKRRLLSRALDSHRATKAAKGSRR